MTDQPSRRIDLVLDTSAIVAYVRGSVAVGETLSEMDAAGGAALVPLTCLLEAAQATALLAQDHLRLLLSHAVTFLIVDDAGEWEALAATRMIVERPDVVSAAWFAMTQEVPVFTAKPDLYDRLGNTVDILLIEEA